MPALYSIFHMAQSMPTRWKVIALFALLGLVSGVLSIISLELLSKIPGNQRFPSALYAPGAVFGVIVSACCAILLRIRSWARLLSLIAASIAAYFLALLLSVYTVVSFRPLEWLSREWSFYGTMFLGGMVGAFVTLTAAQLLLSTQRKWKAIFSAALLWSLAGGALGVAGWALGSSLGKVLWLALHALRLTVSDAELQAAVSDKNVNAFSLFVVWQAGMAPVLGGLLVQPVSSKAPDQSGAKSVSA